MVVLSVVLGSVVRMSLHVASGAGDELDPTSLTFTLKQPDQSLVEYTFGADVEMVRDSAGDYHVDWLTSQPGKHVYRFSGSGLYAGADEESFRVARSRIL